ncbi:MAG: DNA mismatch repair protein MutS [Rhodoferax sp.]|uniref:Smr/MutS family protein n=1 Tax=Rhodoferax sp. TaxID=50421 RepID=UPI001853C5A1|nr:Smr/MutS family protein [Rhodoferax sp.]NMM20091.1 DNA mismatch repair protein MutS [Rhodoferax sp.]
MSNKPVTVKSLADLKLVKREIEAQALQQAALAAELARARLQVASEKNLFILAAGVVKPLPEKRRVLLKKEPVAPRPMQYEQDEKAVLIEAISDEFDVGTLLDVDDLLSFRRPGIGPDVTRKLRRGDWSIQRQLDLHGLRRDEAREQLSFFIREAHKHGIRCVRVVHGKGLGSPGKAPVLKSRVHSWLVQKQEVLAFVQAKPADGGGGALVVLLMASRG